MSQSSGLKYAYFPGCSLQSSAVDYNRSILSTCTELGIELRELEDWNCCGTTAVTSTNLLLSYLLPARNLALAEEEGLDLAVACNSCLVTHRRVTGCFSLDISPLANKIRSSLHKIGRTFRGRVQVRHILDILAEDLGFEGLAGKVKRRLEGLKVVPYYGCQYSRPGAQLKEAEMPESMDQILDLLGVEVKEYSRKTKCCGGVLMTTKPEIAAALVNELLEEAADRGADAIVVTCPLCQMNLDIYQGDVNARFGRSYNLPVVYFTQLLGIALGVKLVELDVHRGFVPAEPLLRKYA